MTKIKKGEPIIAREEKEFNLSEKAVGIGGINVYVEQNIKEFIRLLKNEWPSADALHATIDKLAGEKFA